MNLIRSHKDLLKEIVSFSLQTSVEETPQQKRKRVIVNSRKKAMALVGGLTIASALTFSAVTTFASEPSGDVISPSGEVISPSTQEIKDFADCLTKAGFETTVIDGGNGIQGSTADALKDGWDEAVESCGSAI